MPLSPQQQSLMTALYQDEDISEILNNFTENKQFTDNKDNSPLHIACMNRNKEAIERLLANGFGSSVYDKNRQGLTPLLILCIKESHKLMPVQQQVRITITTERQSVNSNTSKNSLSFFSSINNEEDVYQPYETLELKSLKRPILLDDSTQEDFIEEVKQEEPEDNSDEQTAVIPLSPTANLVRLLLEWEKENKGDTAQLIMTSAPSAPYFAGNPLHLACQYFGDDCSVVTTLLSYLPEGIEPLGEVNNRKETPLSIAAKYGTVPVITSLLNILMSAHEDERSTAEVAIEKTVPTRSFDGDKTVRNMSRGSIGVFVGGMISVVAGIPTAFIFPPLGNAMIIGGSAMVYGGYFGYYGIKLTSGVLSQLLEGNMNLMQLIATHNTPEVMIEFCKQVRADLLLTMYRQSERGISKTSDIIKTRNKQNPSLYNLTPKQFENLIQQELCFQLGVEYFVGKMKSDPRPAQIANYKARMDDFCQVITLLTKFFIDHKGVSAETVTTEFAQLLTEYKNGSGKAAADEIRKTASWKSDDLYNKYRDALLQIDTKMLVRRLNEFCQTVFNAYGLDKKERIVINRVKEAFKAGGYKDPLQNKLEEKKGDESNNISISPSSNR